MASLADLKVTIGADTGPLTKGFQQAQGSITTFSGAFNQANKVLKRGNNTLAEVDGALEALETSFTNARTSAARLAISAKMTELGKLRTEMVKTGQAAQQMSRGFSKTQMTVVNFNRVIQDAPFGILGVANNIEPLLLSMQSLRAEAGSARAAFKQFIKGAFTGPGALITVFSLASTAALVFARRNQGVSSSAKKAQKALEEQAEMVQKLEESYNRFNESSVEETYNREIDVIDRVLALKEKDDKLSLKQTENTKKLINAKTGSIILDEKQKESINAVNESISQQRIAIDDIIKGYGLEQKTVKDLTERREQLLNLVKAYNSVSSDEAKLGSFIQQQQIKTNKVLAAYEAGLKGSTQAAIDQRSQLESMIHSFRLLASQGEESLIPVITALQTELNKLDAVEVQDKAVDVMVDIDTSGMDQDIAKLLANAKKQLEELLDTRKKIEQWNKSFEQTATSINFLTAPIEEVQKVFDDNVNKMTSIIDEFSNRDVVGLSSSIFLVSGSLGALEARLGTLERAQRNFTEAGSEDYLLLGEQIAAIQEILDSYRESTDELTGSQMFLTEVATTFTDSFGKGMANIIVQGEKLNDILKNIGKLLLSSAIQTGISLLLTGGTGNKVTGGLLGSLFPKLTERARGGSVLANTPYLVGEKGPELFTPRSGGYVTSNSDIFGGTSSVNLTGEFRIKGTDLVLSLERSRQVIGR
jgi:hypothetical protein